MHAPRLFLVTRRAREPRGDTARERAVTVLLDALWLVPTLPDPYAASFDPAPLVDRAAIGLLGVSAELGRGERRPSAFTVAIDPAPAGSTPPGVAGPPSSPILPPSVLTLLDLSTNVDLFGVQIEGDSAAGTLASAPRDTGFVGLSLAVSDAAIAVFALPQLSWEPMVNEATSPPSSLAGVAGDRRRADPGSGAEHRSPPARRRWSRWHPSRCCCARSAMWRPAPRSARSSACRSA